LDTPKQRAARSPLRLVGNSSTVDPASEPARQQFQQDSELAKLEFNLKKDD
jgi:hypothetical protein